MVAFGQSKRMVSTTSTTPAVYNESIINVHASTVVVRHLKDICSCGKMLRLGPSSDKTIGVDGSIGRASSPIKINNFVLMSKIWNSLWYFWCPITIWHVPILANVIWSSRLCFYRSKKCSDAKRNNREHEQEAHCIFNHENKEGYEPYNKSFHYNN